jgi:hypothetical protein
MRRAAGAYQIAFVSRCDALRTRVPHPKPRLARVLPRADASPKSPCQRSMVVHEKGTQFLMTMQVEASGV